MRIDPIGEPALLLAGLACAVIALPAIFLAFSALARPEAGRLTLAYVTGNLVLLLPQRQPDAVVAIAAGLLGFLLTLDRRFFARATMLRHRDGVTMRLALLIPLLILVARNLILFGGSPLLAGFVLASSGGFLFLALPGGLSIEWLKPLIRLLGFGMVAAGWAVVANWILDFDGGLSSQECIPVGLLPIAGLAILLSLYAGPGGRVYRKIAGAGAMAALMLQLTAFGGPESILLSLGVAVIMVAGALWASDRTLLVSGIVGFVGTMVYLLFSVREFWAQNLWVSLGARRRDLDCVVADRKELAPADSRNRGAPRRVAELGLTCHPGRGALQKTVLLLTSPRSIYLGDSSTMPPGTESAHDHHAARG